VIGIVGVASTKTHDIFDDVIFQIYYKSKLGYFKPFELIDLLVCQQQHGGDNFYVDHHLDPIVCPVHQMAGI
jgi:hypothetical protein